MATIANPIRYGLTLRVKGASSQVSFTSNMGYIPPAYLVKSGTHDNETEFTHLRKVTKSLAEKFILPVPTPPRGGKLPKS